MATVQRLLGLPQDLIAKHQYTATVFLLLGCLICFLYHKLFLIWETPGKFSHSSPLPYTQPNWYLPSLILLAGVIFFRALLGIEQPFDNDELTLVFAVTKGTPLGHLFHDATHPLSSYLGMFFTKVFGISMFSLRLPSLIFCAAFLLLLTRFCLRFASPLAGLLLVGHLASNYTFTWYFHSTRGYAPMVLMVFIVFSSLYAVTIHNEPMKTRHWVLLSAALILMPFTHGYGMLFSLFATISLAIWTLANHHTLTIDHRSTVFRLNSAMLMSAPYHILGMGYMFYLTISAGNKLVGMAPGSQYSTDTFWSATSTALGMSHAISMKITLLLIATTLFILFRKKFLKQDFSLYVLVSFLSFVALQKALLNSFVTGRFLLGVLPIFIFWLVHSIEMHWSKHVRAFSIPALLLVFVVFPISDGTPGLFQLLHEDYYDFIKSTRYTLKGVTASCIDFSAADVDPAGSEAFIAEKFYFKAKRAGIELPCTSRYQMHFSAAWSPADPKEKRQMGTFEELPHGKTYRLIQSDGFGRFLAKIE